MPYPRSQGRRRAGAGRRTSVFTPPRYQTSRLNLTATDSARGPSATRMLAGGQEDVFRPTSIAPAGSPIGKLIPPSPVVPSAPAGPTPGVGAGTPPPPRHLLQMLNQLQGVLPDREQRFEPPIPLEPEPEYEEPYYDESQYEEPQFVSPWAEEQYNLAEQSDDVLAGNELMRLLGRRY